MAGTRKIKESDQEQEERMLLEFAVNEALYRGFNNYLKEHKAGDEELASWRKRLGIDSLERILALTAVPTDAIRAVLVENTFGGLVPGAITAILEQNRNQDLSSESRSSVPSLAIGDSKSSSPSSGPQPVPEGKGIPRALEAACVAAITETLQREFANTKLPSQAKLKTILKFSKQWFLRKPKMNKEGKPKDNLDTNRWYAQQYTAIFNLCHDMLTEDLNINHAVLMRHKEKIVKMKIVELQKDLLATEEKLQEYSKKVADSKNPAEKREAADIKKTYVNDKAKFETAIEGEQAKLRSLQQGNFPEEKDAEVFSLETKLHDLKLPLDAYEAYINHLYQMTKRGAAPDEFRIAALDSYIRLYSRVNQPIDLEPLLKHFQLKVNPQVIAEEFFKDRWRFGPELQFVSPLSQVYQEVGQKRKQLLEHDLFDTIDAFKDAVTTYNQAIIAHNKKEGIKKEEKREGMIYLDNHGIRIKLSEWVYNVLPGIRVDDAQKKLTLIHQIANLFNPRIVVSADGKEKIDFSHPALDQIHLSALCLQLLDRSKVEAQLKDLRENGLKASSMPAMGRPLSYVSTVRTQDETLTEPAAVQPPGLDRRKSLKERVEESRRASKSRSKSAKNLTEDKGGRSTPPLEASKSSRKLSTGQSSRNLHSHTPQTHTHTPPITSALPATSKERAQKANKEEFIEQYVKKHLFAEKILAKVTPTRDSSAADRKDDPHPIPENILSFVNKWRFRDAAALAQLITVEEKPAVDFKVEEIEGAAPKIIIGKNTLNTFISPGSYEAKKTELIDAATAAFHSAHPEYKRGAPRTPVTKPGLSLEPDLLTPLSFGEDDPVAARQKRPEPISKDKLKMPFASAADALGIDDKPGENKRAAPGPADNAPDSKEARARAEQEAQAQAAQPQPSGAALQSTPATDTPQPAQQPAQTIQNAQQPPAQSGQPAQPANPAPSAESPGPVPILRIPRAKRPSQIFSPPASSSSLFPGTRDAAGGGGHAHGHAKAGVMWASGSQLARTQFITPPATERTDNSSRVEQPKTSRLTPHTERDEDNLPGQLKEKESSDEGASPEQSPKQTPKGPGPGPK